MGPDVEGYNCGKREMFTNQTQFCLFFGQEKRGAKPMILIHGEDKDVAEAI